MLYAIYDLHNVKYVGKRVLTNTPPCGAFRGHGTVDIRFAFESLLDQMAHEMGIDPIAVRRANYLKAPTFTVNDLMINSYGLPECVDWVEKESGWKERRRKPHHALESIAAIKGAQRMIRRRKRRRDLQPLGECAAPIHWFDETNEPRRKVNDARQIERTLLHKGARIKTLRQRIWQRAAHVKEKRASFHD